MTRASSLAELTARKALYLAAEEAILKSQEYRIRDGVIDRWLRRPDLEFVQAELDKIDRMINALGTRRVIYLR